MKSVIFTICLMVLFLFFAGCASPKRSKAEIERHRAKIAAGLKLVAADPNLAMAINTEIIRIRYGLKNRFNQ